MVALEGGTPMMGRTGDINAGGVSINLPGPLPAGQIVHMRFDLLVEGRVVPIKTRARVQHCILSGDDFKIGFQFQNLDTAAAAALTRFMR